MRGRQLLERRSEMLKLRAQGVPLKSIIDDFKDKYGVSPQALYKDWKKRSTWGPDIVELDSPTLLTELIQGLKQVIPNAWYEYKTNPNPSVKVAALKLAAQTYKDIVEILQSVGKIEKVPEEVQLKADIIVKAWQPDEQDS